MSGLRSGPEIALFAVDDCTAQLTWRKLRPGPLRLEARAADGRVLAGDGSQPVDVVVDPLGVGAVVIDGLPPATDLKVVAHGPALGGGRTAIAVRTRASLAGAERARVATIGDLHLGARAFGHRGTIAERPAPAVPHPLRCSQAALDEATEWGAERVLVKGDVTNSSSSGQWRQFAALAARTTVPVEAAPGNHDHVHPSGANPIPPDAAAAAFDLSLADPVIVRDHDGLRVILVDSTIAGRNPGTLDGSAGDVLDAAAGAERTGAVLVLLHHQLQAHRYPEGWPVGVGRAESRRLLAGLGRAHPHVLVSSGHTHRHRRWRHAGVEVTQVGSTKDFPGVWAGYVLYEGGLRQTVRRVSQPDCLAWTDRTRTAALGAWGHVGLGRLASRCFDLAW